MIEDFGDSKKQIMYEDGLPFARGILKLDDDSADIVMFSPPLWGGEIYSDDKLQSINLFKDFKIWKYDFVYKSLEVLWSKLKPGGFYFKV